MKTKLLRYLISGALILVNLSALSAQGKGKAKQENMRTRAMFVGKQTDGIEVKLTDQMGKLVDPGKSFKAGDKVRIKFQANFGGYVYFINVAPSGITKVIHVESVEADKDYLLPGGAFIEFDNEVGTEVLRIVMSHERIKTYDDAMKNAKGELGKSASSVAEELAAEPANKGGKKGQGKPEGEPVGIVTPKDACSRERGLVLASGQEVRCRGLVLASGNKAKNEGSVVAISDNQGGKLNNGDVAIFELRLKHI